MYYSLVVLLCINRVHLVAFDLLKLPVKTQGQCLKSEHFVRFLKYRLVS